MKKKTFHTIREYFYWLYANMGMAHAALKRNHAKYETIDFMIRAKLYKGLNVGTHTIATIYDDEKYKLNNVRCAYCGCEELLSLDHLIPRKAGGGDSGDNLVYACKVCNSSKNDKDIIAWYMEKGKFPPILVLRRYMKLAYLYFEENGYLDLPYECLKQYTNIYRLDLLPYEFPYPENLVL